MNDWDSHAGVSFETEGEDRDDDEEDGQHGYDLADNTTQTSG